MRPMAVSRRADVTGRSGSKLPVGRAKRGASLEKPYIQNPLSLMISPGFRELTNAAHRLIDFLIIEHLKHSGFQNGRLLAPHAQLERYGISGRDILPAIEMCEAFGLIRRVKANSRLMGREGANLFALTWIGVDDDVPTYDYKKVKQIDVERHLAEAEVLRRQRRARASDRTKPKYI